MREREDKKWRVRAGRMRGEVKRIQGEEERRRGDMRKKISKE